ncbi:chromosome segregation protein SMC [Candidatus Chloroploca sp. M-50]|uniref:Chromosome partition protein Smc n=1 Tax=Candidatus Chloroploca mongolica TaxID=2528176 RepID=A0ABS4DEG8_9CHLR|nr:chromosome segregation protein SMC [Candidatus Chloroploca mongolica]MBP1467840.1 chromosome segregation protein SMC [Candidatus Chloroploca mongolica]
MHLKRLEIQGFKTFASRTILEFRAGITAVVGPNGSGKSNLADAVRWVLGEQSLTNLRCKRSEELLYAGGGRRAPAGFAEVSLTVDNSDRLLPVEFDEVTLTRRTTRAGESEYLLNRAKVRLRDLLEVTAPLGGSYTIINQGLVDAALTLRPEERRKLFEDAADLGGFELRKAEALRRLRETEGNLQRLGDLLAELEPRLRVLKRQAAQARQYHEYAAELALLQQQYYVELWGAALRMTAQTRADLQVAEARLTEARTAQVGVTTALQALRTSLRTRRDELGALHQQSSLLHRQAETVQRDLAVGNERVAALARRTEDLDRQRHELALRQAQAEQQHAEAIAETRQTEAELAEREQALREVETELAGRADEVQALVRALREAEEAALRTTRAAAEAHARLEQINAQTQRLARETSELEASIAQAEAHVASSTEQVADARAQVSYAETARHEAATAEQALRHDIETLRQHYAQADEQRVTARRALADVEARFESLSRLARSYTGTFAGVRAAMQWAERTQRQGFALVQSLIRTPAELETALEVALGSRLQNIVVEQWSDAEAAIAELKQRDVGRATFMPLDTLRVNESDQRPLTFDDEAVLGVAADLVAYDAPYRPVVEQLLGRVLIVRDLPTARRELRRLRTGWNIVTLQGEQVNSGGSLTGGARTKESGALRRERELRELPAQVAAARQNVEAADTLRVQLDTQLKTLNGQLREVEGRTRESQRLLETARSGVAAAERRLAQAEQERTWAAQRRERLDSERQSLDMQQHEVRQRLGEVENTAHATEVTLAELRTRQAHEASNDRLVQERLAVLRTEVATTRQRLRAAEQLRNNHAQSLALVQRQTSELDQAALSLRDERDALAAQHERHEALHTALLTEIDELRQRIDPAEAALHNDEANVRQLEAQEEAATTHLLAMEAAQSKAALDAQRAADRQEALFERAAADGVNLEHVATSDAQAVPAIDATHLQASIEALKTKILRLGAVNQLALEEYETTAERQRFLATQLADLRAAGATLLELIGELDEAMNHRFTTTFHAIAAEFEQSFTRLFGGGSARLILTSTARQNGQASNGTEPETVDTRSLGVEIVARPPGKKQQNIALLSGGERSLTATALLFAILTVHPTPFCILDETDAALDEANVGRFREALQHLTNQTQFILITHNRGTIEAADTLYGVTMGDDGASKMMSLRIEQYIAEG